MRRLAAEHPDLQIVHRCFALAPTPERIAQMFGSKERGKREILDHWRAANANDDEHRMNPELMATRPFNYPYSMPGLKACKAAEMQGGPDFVEVSPVGGHEAHWAMFDRIQRAHLTECLNIAEFGVLRSCARDVGLDLARWEADYSSSAVENAVHADLERADAYGITGVPSLVADGKHLFVGAQPYTRLVAWIESLSVSKAMG